MNDHPWEKQKPTCHPRRRVAARRRPAQSMWSAASLRTDRPVQGPALDGENVEETMGQWIS